MSDEAYPIPEASTLMNLLIALKEHKILSLVQKLVSEGVDPLQTVECCQTDMRDVGRYYETNRYYLSGQMMAGEVLRQVMDMLLLMLKEKILGFYDNCRWGVHKCAGVPARAGGLLGKRCEDRGHYCQRLVSLR